MLDRPAALRPRAEEHRAEPGDEKHGRHDIGEDAEVRILVALREVDPDQQREREQRADGEDAANRAIQLLKCERGRAGTLADAEGGGSFGSFMAKRGGNLGAQKTSAAGSDSALAQVDEGVAHFFIWRT